MKIPPIQRQSIVGAYEKAHTQSIQRNVPMPRPDAVEISPDAVNFSETFRKVMQSVQEPVPNALERFDRTVTQFRAGEYNVPAQDVAAAILYGMRLEKQHG